MDWMRTLRAVLLVVIGVLDAVFQPPPGNGGKK
jgi:hypothetical protein